MEAGHLFPPFITIIISFFLFFFLFFSIPFLSSHIGSASYSIRAHPTCDFNFNQSSRKTSAQGFPLLFWGGVAILPTDGVSEEDEKRKPELPERIEIRDRPCGDKMAIVKLNACAILSVLAPPAREMGKKKKEKILKIQDGRRDLLPVNKAPVSVNIWPKVCTTATAMCSR